MSKGFDKGFAWKISICSSMTYLLATVTQVVTDPLLLHDVNFSSRQYPHAVYYITPLFIFVFIVTYYVMRRSTRIFLNIIPFTVAAVASIPVFRPEVPHGNLFGTTFVWLTILMLTLWIRNREIASDARRNLNSSTVSNAAKIEYLKEEVQFWRMLLVGVAGGYLAVLISWASLLMAYNKNQVGGNDAEAYILSQASFFSIGFYSIVLTICPIVEAALKHRQATNLFLTIREKSH